MTPERERLKVAIEARAVELRLRLKEVAQRAGMSDANFGRIRNGTVTLTPFAIASIESALQWGEGSIRSILDGGAPIPRSNERSSVPTSQDTLAAVTREVADLSHEKLQDVLTYVKRMKSQPDGAEVERQRMIRDLLALKAQAEEAQAKAEEALRRLDEMDDGESEAKSA